MIKLEPGRFTVLENSDNELLLCQHETLDRKSPDLWPEVIPGVSNFTPSSTLKSPVQPVVKNLNFDDGLDKEDLDMLQEFGSLSMAQLMERIRGMQNLVYQLGLDEARQMTRGKFLNILGKTSKAKKCEFSASQMSSS